MEKDNSKEKKDLKLKVITPVDIRRFKSKQLHKIIESFRTKNKNISVAELEKNDEYLKLIKYSVRQSLIRRADKHRRKMLQKINDRYLEDKEYLEELLEDGEITKEEYKKELEQVKYKARKEIYARDYFSNKVKEKPKNPRMERIKEVLGKVTKNVAKVITFPFVAAYKGIKAIGRGGTNALLTAGKVAEKGVKVIKDANQEVTETQNAKRDIKAVEKSKDLDSTDKIKAKREIYDNSSEQTKKAIEISDWKAALRENKRYEEDIAEREEFEDEEKQEREEKRRENLNMDPQRQEINHEEAMKNAEEEINRISKEMLKGEKGEK